MCIVCCFHESNRSPFSFSNCVNPFLPGFDLSPAFYRYLETKAVDIGMTHILIEACHMQGKKYENLMLLLA